MSWAQPVAIALCLVVIPAWAVWHNMHDGRGGNNLKPTRNRGISGERGDEYRDS
jgi:hypothetical protein